jgi:membrane fusion protein (multidrug efflux system)
MANPFQRTTRSLRGERDVFQLLFLGGCSLALAAWGVWFVAARFPVFVASETARIETGQAAVSLASPVGGRLRRVTAVVGERVKADAVLAELDTEIIDRQLEEERAQLAALGGRIEEARGRREALLQGLAAAGSARGLARQEAAEKSRSAAAAAALAGDELRRKEQLFSQGLLSASEVAVAWTAAEQRRSEAAGLGIGSDLLVAEHTRDEADRAADLRETEGTIAELDGDRMAQEAVVQRLTAERRQRSILAPAAGRIGELARLEAGAVVQPGEHLGTLVPDARLRVLGGFLPAAAIGRVRPGQPAEVRLDAFPWAEFGVLPARVERVSSELRQGRIWVELAIEESAVRRIPLQHGLSGSVLVETERLSPAALLLRSLGKALR